MSELKKVHGCTPMVEHQHFGEKYILYSYFFYILRSVFLLLFFTKFYYKTKLGELTHELLSSRNQMWVRFRGVFGHNRFRQFDLQIYFSSITCLKLYILEDRIKIFKRSIQFSLVSTNHAFLPILECYYSYLCKILNTY